MLCLYLHKTEAVSYQIWFCLYSDITAVVTNRSHKFVRLVTVTEITLLRPVLPNPQGTLYRGADKSLARPGRKQANVSVRMAFGI